MPNGSSELDKIATSSVALSCDALLKLARVKSRKTRSALMTAIIDLSTDSERVLTANDRMMIKDIMSKLIVEVELSVRQALAVHLSELPGVPRELAICFANDEISVARPILLKSEVLRDPELIEIIQYRTMEHQLAVAMRVFVSEAVSDALVDANHPEVITTLIQNTGAQISEPTLELLTEKSATTTAFQEPLLNRQDLPPRLVKKLYWVVSAALREDILRKFQIDPSDLDEKIEDAVENAYQALLDVDHTLSQHIDADRNATPHDPQDKTNSHELITLLRRGDTRGFLDLFSKLSKLRLTLVRRIIFEPGGEALAVVSKVLNLKKDDLAVMLLLLRQGRLGDKQVQHDELTKALEFFDRIKFCDARSVVQRWRRNPEYLNALRIVEKDG